MKNLVLLLMFVVWISTKLVAGNNIPLQCFSRDYVGEHDYDIYNYIREGDIVVGINFRSFNILDCDKLNNPVHNGENIEVFERGEEYVYQRELELSENDKKPLTNAEKLEQCMLEKKPYDISHLDKYKSDNVFNPSIFDLLIKTSKDTPLQSLIMCEKISSEDIKNHVVTEINMVYDAINGDNIDYWKDKCITNHDSTNLTTLLNLHLTTLCEGLTWKKTFWEKTKDSISSATKVAKEKSISLTKTTMKYVDEVNSTQIWRDHKGKIIIGSAIVLATVAELSGIPVKDTILEKSSKLVGVVKNNADKIIVGAGNVASVMSKSTPNIGKKILKNQKLVRQTINYAKRGTKFKGGRYNRIGNIEFDKIFGKINLPKFMWKKSDTKQFSQATKLLWEKIKNNPSMGKQFDKKALNAIKMGSAKIPGYTWHHSPKGVGNRVSLELVDEVIHNSARHTGGRALSGTSALR